MRVRELACGALVLGMAAAPSSAWSQATKDEARLIFTVSGGAVAGQHLWSVAAQPVQFIDPADTVRLSRRIRSSIMIGFSGTYFRGRNFGLAVEGVLLGIGFEDDCQMVFSSGAGAVDEACLSLQGATKSASAVALSASPIFRVNSQKLISPYVRANLGLVFSNQSSLRTIGNFPTPDGISELAIYEDSHDSRVGPMLGLGAGITAQVARGYQLRWEVRDNIVGVQRVTSATALAGVEPPHRVTYKHLFSLAIGFDVVLERRPGRRY
jgi:hypothetical protein